MNQDHNRSYIIKLLAIYIALVLTVRVFSQTPVDTRKITLNFTGQPLSYALNEIRIHTNANFIYDDKLIEGLNVTCRIKNLPVETAVKKILSRFDISYKSFSNNTYVLLREKRPAAKHFVAEIVSEKPPFRSTEEILIEPELISKNRLEYPAEAVRRNIEGKVKINLLITKEGNVSRAVIEQPSGSAILDSATVDYSHSLKFIPAKVGGKPRNIWIAMLFKFFLENK